MKQKGKILLTLLAVALLVCIATVSLAACGDKNEQTHEHTFAEEWSHDDEYHWHAATCGHNDQMKDRAEHELVLTATTPASCEDDGVQTGTCVCGYSETKSIDAIGHDYTPSWDWDSDHGGATLVLTCGNDPTHKLTTPANVTRRDETDGCGAYIIYTATASILGETYTDTQRVEKGALHQYKFSKWEWADDYSSAVAVFVCQKDKSHVYKSDPVTPQKLEEEQPSCTTNGHIKYKVSYEFEHETYEDEQTQVLPMSHTFEKWVYTQEPDCTKDGKKRQQCSVCGKLYGDEEKVDALGHDFKTAWSYDNDEHWHKCSRCNATDDHLAHTLNDEGECSVCDYAAETPANEFAFSAASNGSWMLTSYNGHRSSVVIPSQYYGQPVTAIDVEAFYNNKTMISLTVPETVEKIESRAFSGCEKLQNVVLSSNLTSISQNAFEGCGAIENVTYPSIAIGSVPKENLVTLHITNGTVPANTYKDCAKLKSITLDEAVTEIGANAFENCTNITQLTVPDSVTTIGKAAFGGCSGLEQLTIPFVGGNSSATEASASTLFGYIFSKEAFEGGTRTLQHFSSSDTVVYYIPSKLANVTVTSKSLLHGAFYNCNMLSEVSFGEGVTAIGDEAFFSCQNLQTVNFSEQLASIGYSAFAYCVKIEKINVPESIQTIGKKAFDVTGWFNAQNDGAIYIQHVLYQYKGTMPADTTITIEDGTVSITAEAFLGCSNLTTLNIPSTIQTYGEKAFEGCDNITNATLPASAIAHITKTNLETVEITTGEIPQDTFRSQNKLKRLTIGSGVYSIGNTAFAYCSSLTTVNWNAINCTKVGIFEAGSSSRYDKDNTIFLGCGNITVVNVGDNIRTIPQYAFYKRSSVTTVNVSSLKVWCNISFGNEYANPLYYGAKLYVDGEILPSELKLQGDVGSDSVGSYSFCNYQGISSVDIGGNFKYISKYAFYNCNNLVQVKISDLVYDIGDHAFAGCSELKTISIGDRVTTIRSFAFQDCKQLTTVTIPDSINSIGEGILQGCNSIDSISIPSKSFASISACSEESSSVKNISHGFGYIFGIKTREITTNSSHPQAQNYNGEIYSGIYKYTSKYSYSSTQYTYTNYYYLIPSSLKTIILTSGKEIESLAFYNCKQLQSISIPDSVTSIGDYAFSNCTGLTEVIIPDSVTSIGEYAFCDCTGLTEVIIPDSVTSIGEYAFYGCTNITKFNYLGTLKSWCEMDFGDFYHIASPLYAANNNKAGTAKLYVNDEEVTGDVNIPAGTTKIGYAAFYGLTGITSVTVPDSVTNINKHAFSGCTGLQTATINAQSIGEAAFSRCSGLKTVTIGEGVTSIGDDAFYGCTGLQKVTICEGVTKIEYGAFYSCAALQEIIIPASLTRIENNAFYSCKALKKVFYGGSKTTWGSISIDNNNNSTLKNAERYYYADEDPYLTNPSDNELYWHWDEETHTPEVWVKEN